MKVKKYYGQKIKWLNFCVFEKNQTKKMIKLNKVTLKQAEAAVCNIRRKTPVLVSFFDKVAGFFPQKVSIFTEKHLC